MAAGVTGDVQSVLWSAIQWVNVIPRRKEVERVMERVRQPIRRKSGGVSVMMVVMEMLTDDVQCSPRTEMVYHLLLRATWREVISHSLVKTR